MNILIVNDDGYQSKKLHLLAEAFKKYGTVFIVAPHYEQSGASSSITVHKGLAVHQHGPNSWSVEGTPSDCVKFALFGLKLKIDLVASGINNGPNLGLDTIYSGTVGACMEALIFGKIAMAFSSETNVEVERNDLDQVINVILDRKLYSNQYILNINFPKTSKSKSIAVTSLGIKPFENGYELKNNQYFPNRTSLEFLPEENTDLYAFEQSVISITPLKLGNGDDQLTEHLKCLIKRS